MAAGIKKRIKEINIEEKAASRSFRPWERTEGGLAQLGEHLPCKQGVESSNLLVSSCNYCITDSDCRTYLENRILKIQNNEKTSEVKLFIE